VLIAGEMTMQELRQARKLTKVQMAKNLGSAQQQISEIENAHRYAHINPTPCRRNHGRKRIPCRSVTCRAPVALAGIAASGRQYSTSVSIFRAFEALLGMFLVFHVPDTCQKPV
jgi:hypothetical protein